MHATASALSGKQKIQAACQGPALAGHAPVRQHYTRCRTIHPSSCIIVRTTASRSSHSCKTTPDSKEDCFAW